METFLWDNVVPAMVVFGIFLQMVLVHELGHFFVMKAAKVGVTSFSVGLPLVIPWRSGGKWTMKVPKLSIKIGGTEYCLNFLPLGGYCNPQNDDKPGSLDIQPLRVRIAILLAGVTMNLIVAASIFGWVYHDKFSLPIPQAAVQGVKFTAEVTNEVAKTLTNPETYKNPDNFGSIVQIVQATSQIVTCSRRDGNWDMIVRLAALLQINLALVNLLPIPGLDGGTALLLIILRLAPKRFVPEFKVAGGGTTLKMESIVILSGFGLLVILSFYLITKDLMFPVKVMICP